MTKKCLSPTNGNGESLYKTLSEKGNPQLNSIRNILNNLGFKLAVEVNASSN
ncbi:MAG: hypothetical protein QNJ32_00485 [Xenococcaceae cyanobacterium MO_167.B27]|nr:hypothetical protein [Xenococcaceae cyanobacterium MO_167.B27]